MIVHILATRPYSEQRFCADRGYAFEDVHEIVLLQGYLEHIKPKRKRNEPKTTCPILGEKTFLARRWVVERTFIWSAKRRSVATRWCKKLQNWLAFVHMAGADIVLGLISG